MPAQNSGLKSSDGQVESSQANLADLIKSTAEKDTRIRPWQTVHKDGQATERDDYQDLGAKMNGEDKYWMAEGSVNASS